MDFTPEEALAAIMSRRRTELGDHRSSMSSHFGDARLQKLLVKMSKVDPDAVAVVIDILEDMERTNNKKLQNAGTYEELVTCREFAKCTGMLIRKLKKAQYALKKQEALKEEAATQMLGEDDGV